MKTYIGAAILVSSLAACSSGGGSSNGRSTSTTGNTTYYSAGAEFTLTSIDPSWTPQSEGDSRIVDFISSSDGTIATTDTNDYDYTSAQFVVADNGEVIGVGFDTDYGRVTLDLDDLDDTYVTDTGLRVFIAGDTVLVTPSELTDSYTAVAGWGRLSGPDHSPSRGDHIRTGFVSPQYTTKTLPSGPANYSGQSVGYYANGSETGFTTSAIVLSTEDFETLTLRSSQTDLVAADNSTSRSAPELDFDATLTRNGSVFHGDFSNDAVSGSATAQAYGTEASEINGTFAGSTDGGSYIGAFSAER